MNSLQLGAFKAHLTLLIIALTAFCLMSGSIGQESFKFGVVNTQEVLEGYKEATEAAELLKSEGKRLEGKLKQLADEIQTLQEKKIKTEQFIEGAETANLNNEIRFRQQEYQLQVERGQQDLLKKEQELMEPVYNTLQELIVNVGESEGFDLILEKRLITLYVSEKYDLTQRLIGLINESSE